MLWLAVFGVWLDRAAWCALVSIQWLYPRQRRHEASPKAISERTSYLVVCLDFHSYPQLRGAVFSLHPFGPPLAVTQASPWLWIAHSPFGSAVDYLTRFTHSLSLGLLRRTDSPCSPQQLPGPLCKRYAVRRDVFTGRPRSGGLPKEPFGTDRAQWQRCHSPSTFCRYEVSGSISLPSQGSFSPFPHGTGPLSVAGVYLALGSGLPGFTPTFT